MNRQLSRTTQPTAQIIDGDNHPPAPPTGEIVDWARAERYLKFLFESYQQQIASSMDRVNGKILPLMKKVHDGERTQRLYQEILDLSSPSRDGEIKNGPGRST